MGDVGAGLSASLTGAILAGGRASRLGGVAKGLLDVGGTRIDLIAIEYAGGDRFYLPVYRLNQIQKYSGGDHGEPKIDRLGGVSLARASRQAFTNVVFPLPVEPTTHGGNVKAETSQECGDRPRPLCGSDRDDLSPKGP